MQLTSKQTSYLRSLAHKLNPAVQLGKAGLTPALMTEIGRNLSDHELIKIRVGGEDREELKSLSAKIAAATQAHLIQIIGHIAVLYRPAEEPVISLPPVKTGGKSVVQGSSARRQTATKKRPPKIIRAGAQ